MIAGVHSSTGFLFVSLIESTNIVCDLNSNKSYCYLKVICLKLKLNKQYKKLMTKFFEPLIRCQILVAAFTCEKMKH